MRQRGYVAGCCDYPAYELINFILYSRAMNYLRVYCIGIGVLVVAIAANTLASFSNLATWYDFIENRTINILDIVWLFIVYPLILGLGATWSAKIWQYFYLRRKKD